MLIEFRVENHRSLRDEQVLTMEAAPLGDPKDPRPRQVDGHAERLLPVAALYGPNASGKSNVLHHRAATTAAVTLNPFCGPAKKNFTTSVNSSAAPRLHTYCGWVVR